MTLSADKAQREREAAVVEAANEIYNAQCDTGRTFDNSLGYEQIAAVIAKVEQSAFEAGQRERAQLHIEVLRCKACGAMSISVDDIRQDTRSCAGTGHGDGKCAGAWTVLVDTQFEAGDKRG